MQSISNRVKYRIVKAVVQRSTFVHLVWFEELFDSVVLLTAFLFCVFAVVHLLHSGQSQCRFHEDFTRAISAESVMWQGFREEREEYRFIPTTLGLHRFQRDETLMKPH